MHNQEQLIAEILDENLELTLYDISKTLGLNGEQVITMVDEGIINPQGSTPEEWIFYYDDIRRIRVSIQLRRDLQVNLAGAGLALELLDEIERLENQIRELKVKIHF